MGGMRKGCMRKLLATLAVASFGFAAQAQAPAFEVASIKRNTSVGQLSSINGQPGGRITVTNHTLRNIVRNINRLQAYQLAGGPAWIDEDRWDIIAKAEGDPAFEQMVAMMRTLLADRFKLVTHRETRELPVYALVLARPDGRFGPQLRVTTATDCTPEAEAARARANVPPVPPGARPRCGVRFNTGVVMASSASLADIVRTLSLAAERQVVDKTGLKGRYDLDLTWKDDTEGPSFFTAVQEQLGLKLESQRGPVEVLVIDSAQRPVED
jgi:uncharacterized protein (TIGR03435 family)